MKIISIFSFHFGDVIGGNSGINDWIKVGVPIFFSVGIVLFQRHKDKKREQRKNIMKLFNLNQHVKHVINQHTRIKEIFGGYSAKVLKDPFDENILLEKIAIPDFVRMLDINKDDVFSAYNSIYSNKEEAATDYRILYNSIEYYKQVFELLYNRYDIISNDIFEERKAIREHFFLANVKHAHVIAHMENTIGNYQQFPAYVELTSISKTYSKKLKELEEANRDKPEAEKLSTPLSFIYEGLINPLLETLPKYKNIPMLLDLYVDIAKLGNLQSYSVHSAIEMGTQLRDNLAVLPGIIEKLQEKSNVLDGKLKPYLKHTVKISIKKQHI